MLGSAVVQTDLAATEEAGRYLGAGIIDALGGANPDAVIVFASSQYEYEALLKALKAACNPRILVGCSSAGEFSSGMQGEGSACAVALRSDDMAFSAGMVRHLSADRAAAASELVKSFTGLEASPYPYRTAILLADALPGYTDEFLEHLVRLTGGAYQFAGGGAGDDARFRHTHVFFGTEAVSDAAVVLEVLSHRPVGIGVRHGWECAGPPMRVTESDGTTLVSLNAVPAADVVDAYAEETGQAFERENPVPFFLHNVLGVQAGDGYKLRVPLAVQESGALHCASDVPARAITRFMKTDVVSARDAAQQAAEDAVAQLAGATPGVALFFDCVATRLRIGQAFGSELDAVQSVLGPARFGGCNTYGQIARSEGQFSGFHNCTAVVCVFPE